MGKRISEKAVRLAAEAWREHHRGYSNISANMEDEIAAIKQKYADELEGAKKGMETAEETISAYTDQNREALLGDKKSTDFYGLKLGYRKAAAKLSLTEGSDWDTVISKAQKYLPDFLITKTELNKRELIRQRDDIDTKTLTKLGVEIVQNETFFVKL